VERKKTAFLHAHAVQLLLWTWYPADYNEFSKYRLRLVRKGLVDGSTRGKMVFTLPLFKEFVLNQIEYM
jgi:hypothetical protein